MSLNRNRKEEEEEEEEEEEQEGCKGREEVMGICSKWREMDDLNDCELG